MGRGRNDASGPLLSVLADGHYLNGNSQDHNFSYAERQLAQPSLQNSVSLGQHQGGVPIPMGSWQTSNALALQARLCGSVTRRFHQPPPRLRPGRPISIAGRMRFRRASYALPLWAQLPPPLPIHDSTSFGTNGNRSSLKPSRLTCPFGFVGGAKSGSNCRINGAVIFAKRSRTAFGRYLNPRSKGIGIAASSASTSASACFLGQFRE